MDLSQISSSVQSWWLLAATDPTSLAIDSVSIPKVLVNVSGLSDLISSWKQWLLLMLCKVPVSSETCVSSLNGLSQPFTNLRDSNYGLQGCDMIKLTLECWWEVHGKKKRRKMITALIMNAHDPDQVSVLYMWSDWILTPAQGGSYQSH